jgi:hypothetical protein
MSAIISVVENAAPLDWRRTSVLIEAEGKTTY